MGPRTKHPGKKGNKVHTKRTKVGLSDRHNTQRPPDSSGDHWTKKTKLATTRGCTMSEKRPVRKEGSHGTAAQGSDHVLITFNEPNELAKISGPRRGRVAIQTSRGDTRQAQPKQAWFGHIDRQAHASKQGKDLWQQLRQLEQVPKQKDGIINEPQSPKQQPVSMKSGEFPMLMPWRSKLMEPPGNYTSKGSRTVASALLSTPPPDTIEELKTQVMREKPAQQNSWQCKAASGPPCSAKENWWTRNRKPSRDQVGQTKSYPQVLRFPAPRNYLTMYKASDKPLCLTEPKQQSGTGHKWVTRRVARRAASLANTSPQTIGRNPEAWSTQAALGKRMTHQ